MLDSIDMTPTPMVAGDQSGVNAIVKGFPLPEKQCACIHNNLNSAPLSNVSPDNSGMVSFAKDDSRNMGTAADLFSLQALNDSLSAAGAGATTLEINLRAEKPSKKSRSKSRTKQQKNTS